MLLATNISLLEWVLLATILACGTGVLWRTFVRGEAGVPSPHDVEENERAQARAEGRIADLEVRLHDFAREVEARMETRALRLDSLVVAGDREIVRLSTLLNQLSDSIGTTRQPDVTHFDPTSPVPSGNTLATATPSKSATSTVSPAQAEMVSHLDGAGYGVVEIAQIVGHTAEVVRSLLKKAA
jgi:hypothetical protein